MGYNRAIVQGNITRDIELHYTPSGKAVATLSVAVNEKHGDKETVLFMDCICWEKTAENCAKYLKKGSKVLVEGCLRSRTWDDKETGQKRTKMEITAHQVVFLDSKPDGGGAEHGEQPQDDDLPF